MLAKSTRRAAIAAAVLAAGVSIGLAQADAQTSDAYRDAVTRYIKTANAAIAVEPLKALDNTALERGVEATIAAGDERFIEAAAMLHLDIGVAVVGISSAVAWQHLALGVRLIDNILPVNPDVKVNLTVQAMTELSKVRVTWLGVAGSAFLSVNNVGPARPFFTSALKINPKSAPLLTLAGTAEEVDGEFYDPDDWDSLASKTRASRDRTNYMVKAERFYRSALEHDSGYALAMIRLGRVQFLSDNMRPAREWLEKGAALAKDPSHRYLAAMFLGAVHQRQKDYDRARESYERALEIAPLSQNAHVALAYLELIDGRPDRAQTLARSYLGTPNSDEGWWAFKNGTLDHAGLQWLRQRVRR